MRGKAGGSCKHIVYISDQSSLLHMLSLFLVCMHSPTPDYTPNHPLLHSHSRVTSACCAPALSPLLSWWQVCPSL